MTTPIAAAGLAPVTPPAASPVPAGQDLFQYLATVNPSGVPAAPNPGQLGGAMADNLKGFLERSQSMTGRAQDLVSRTPEAPRTTLVHRGASDAAVAPQAPTAGPNPKKPPVGTEQMEKMIQALGMMFDYSIETQMVVRGTTQISGAANTLLRGQ